MNDKKFRVNIAAITAPLGFFVLALLIVEVFLATIVLGTDLPIDYKAQFIWTGIALFIFVVLVVCIFSWFKPESLTFDKSAHLASRGSIEQGGSPLKNRMVTIAEGTENE